MATQAPSFELKKRYLAYLLLCLIALYAVIPQLHAVRGSLPLIADADRTLIALAIAAALFSYVAAANVYVNLSIKPIKFSRTVFMQFVSMFANRLLPAGIGGMGVNYLYLKKQRHSTVQATSVVAASNTLGFIGHMSLVLAFIAFSQSALPYGNHNDTKVWAIVLIPGLVLIIASVLLPKFRKRISLFLRGVGLQLLQYRKHPKRLATAYISSLTLTMANIVALQLSCMAVGIHLSLAATLLIFTFGLSIGTATPTPGSLGGIEAGLVGGMLVYNISPASALGSVLLFRLVSYWLPLLIGISAFVIARQRRYF